MDPELKKRIHDYFDSWELVELLKLETEDVITAFEDEVLENIDDIKELMGIDDE
jgi:hypothetical protein